MMPSIATAEGWYACYGTNQYGWYVYYRVMYWLNTEEGTQGVFLDHANEIARQRGDEKHLSQTFIGYYFHPSSKAAYFPLKELRHEVIEDI